METLTTRWLVTIMMVDLCFYYKGSLAHPSHLDCYIPCDGKGCGADIICTWDSKPDPNNNISYTLHWESYETKATGNSAIIQRHRFTSHSILEVRVQARNQRGEVNISKPAVINTAHILKPPPPKVTSSSQEPVELHWISPCDQLMLEAGQCEVRHRTEEEQAWIQPEEGGISGSYTLDNHQPSTNYLFQVRCACGTSLMSNWSEVHAIRSEETAPDGKLDVWRDCGMLLTSPDCVLTWKKLPMSQAHGQILGYNLSLIYKNGTSVSVAAPVGAWVCDDVHCYLNSSLDEDVTSVSISAYNALGVTAPSHLDITAPVKITNQKAIYLEMNKNNLTVSWDMPSWITDNVKEYIVQYKEDGCPLGQGFNWVRVNKSQAIETIKGQFKKYTAYQVSVFTVLDNNKQQFFSSDIAHFVQGVPAKVPIFKVISYGSTHVTLLWKPVLLSKQNGITPYYQIGVDKNNVYNESAYPQLENRTIKLSDLIENQDYQMWIRAVNQAGPGPNTTVLLKTLPNENIEAPLKPILVLGIVVFLIVAVLVILFYVRFFSGEIKVCHYLPFCEKVPDPYNSNILREMKHQINESMAWLCIPVMEQHPTLLSFVEIVDNPPSSFNIQPDNITRIEGEDTLEDITRQRNRTQHGKQEYSKMVDSDEDDSKDSSEEDHSGYEKRFMPTDMEILEEYTREQHRCGREEYSKMIDSDEEKNEEEDDSPDSSEEDHSGYEKHFMPTDIEIMEGHRRTQHQCAREEYSKMTDSDEAKNREDKYSWSSEEDKFSSGYERHFMPTISEIMEV